jgi:polyphenol oxidase
MTSAAESLYGFPMLTPVTCPALSSLAGIRHAWFTREGGVSEGPLYGSLNGGLGSQDERDRVIENRKRMAKHMGVRPERFLSVWQVHSPDVITVSGPWEGERPKADALVTATAGLAITIATADCGPVLFADSEAKVVGAAHAGWQGAFKGVLEATIEAMETLGARRASITATIGPMLSQANYEVGPEFIQRFHAQAVANARFFRPSPKAGHAMFDLPAYNAMRLRKAGVGTVHDLALCTYADEQRFFSYRRTTHRQEPDYGRLISAITIEK